MYLVYLLHCHDFTFFRKIEYIATPCSKTSSLDVCFSTLSNLSFFGSVVKYETSLIQEIVARRTIFSVKLVHASMAIRFIGIFPAFLFIMFDWTPKNLWWTYSFITTQTLYHVLTNNCMIQININEIFQPDYL